MAANALPLPANVTVPRSDLKVEILRPLERQGPRCHVDVTAGKGLLAGNGGQQVGAGVGLDVDPRGAAAVEQRLVAAEGDDGHVGYNAPRQAVAQERREGRLPPRSGPRHLPHGHRTRAGVDLARLEAVPAAVGDEDQVAADEGAEVGVGDGRIGGENVDAR